MAKTERLAGRLVQKVPLFFGFKPVEMKAFLDICKLSTSAKGEVLCENNTSSNRLFILLDGSLDILGPGETVLATVTPITTVGEMGFISRKPRSATVQTHNASRLLKVDYHEFEALMERYVDLRAKVYRNMVRILSDKLVDANDRVIHYRKLYESGAAPQQRETEDMEVALEEQPVPSEKGPEKRSEEDEETRLEESLQLFYELAKVEGDEAQKTADRESYLDLRKNGYTDADIEYAIKWAVRNIPSIKRFSLVRLSIDEAFENKWDL
ncbi:MAG: cyclic nucleotide-binding domain-containing protein [Gemmatimonadetes bacterium]|jgi:CRP-like cAMP-binding protein|nr:cyclic nucleotide-binding domain-containing protein [Gemmatimonadota bacterium]